MVVYTGAKDLSDPKIKFDIGANNGENTQALANDGSIVYAFEPSPLLYPNLVERFKYNTNVIILPFAVDIVDDIKPFNVSDVGDRGVGSLYPFHKDIKDTPLSGAAEFTTPPSWIQNVLTIRLGTFMSFWNIPKIDYLHIDAQGSDLNAIKSLSTRIYDVVEGQLECTLDIPLYANADNYYKDAVTYLEAYGFEVTTLYEHANRSEIDLHFKRKI